MYRSTSKWSPTTRFVRTQASCSSLLQLIPFLVDNENVDIRKLTEEVISGMGLSRRIIIPEAELQEMQAEMMEQQGGAVEAQAQAALGGAAGGQPFLEAQQMQQIQATMAQLPLEDQVRMAKEIEQKTGISIPLPPGLAEPGQPAVPAEGSN